jgi:hypothetical protein
MRDRQEAIVPIATMAVICITASRESIRQFLVQCAQEQSI